MDRAGKICKSAIETIGRTPLVELSRITQALAGRIFVKLEYLNPGLSKKDRIALQMIEDAEKSGDLKPGQTVVELTSGNTGTGLAIVCAVKGYPFVAVMSKGNTVERERMMAALGAEVVLVDQAPGALPGQVSGESLALVEKVTQRIVKERGAFRADQFKLESNVRAHYLHTGREIIRQSDGRVDVFCDFAGTGGSFAGISKALRENNPQTLCYLIEPQGAAVLSGGEVTNQNHKIQGGGYSIRELKFLRGVRVDGYIQVTDEETIATAWRLAREEGLFAGFSSGANVAGAIRLLKGPCKGKTIAVLLCDSGMKYLSTDLWAPLETE